MTKHEQMVAGLVKPGEMILAQLTLEDCHLWHMATGLMGESVELQQAIIKNDLDNFIEEGGDSCFYQTALYQIRGIAYHEEADKTPESTLADLTEIDNYLRICGDILDLVKKKVIYRKLIDEIRIDELLIASKISLRELAGCFTLSIGTFLDHNYNKLGKRYEGHQYTDEQAQLRKDKE